MTACLMLGARRRPGCLALSCLTTVAASFDAGLSLQDGGTVIFSRSLSLDDSPFHTSSTDFFAAAMGGVCRRGRSVVFVAYLCGWLDAVADLGAVLCGASDALHRLGRAFFPWQKVMMELHSHTMTRSKLALSHQFVAR